MSHRRYGTSRKSCKGKCIPVDEPCDGECTHFGQCLLDGKCNEEDVWKGCNGTCINKKDKCQGTCGEYQCESETGSCLDTDWEILSCKGKCIKQDEPCEGKCNEYDGLCERKGKCLEMFDDKTEEYIWKNCNGK